MMKDTIVLYTPSGKGHLIPMVELAKLILHHHGNSFSVTIIVSVLPLEAEFTDSYISSASAAATGPSLSFLRLPSTVQPGPAPPTALENGLSSYESAGQNNPSLRTSLLSLTNVKAVVLDFFCSAASEVSTSLGIPTYYFFTSGAYTLASFLYVPALDKKYPNFKDMDADERVEIPGYPLLSPRDMPLALSEKSHKIYHLFLNTAIDMSKSAGIILNTFENLEPGGLEVIRSQPCPLNGRNVRTYCIGPVVAVGNGGRAEHECLNWLDRQPFNSVLLLSFGSMGIFSGKQLKEMAVGLERSGARFLWVARVPREDDEMRRTMGESGTRLEAFLPEGFLERTQERGYVVESWAPQVDILNHPAAGGFVTHCGWNSVLEATCAGVPMLAWPLYAEQKLNRAYLVEKIEVAMAIGMAPDGFVSAEELEEGINKLMHSDRGRKIRERVSAMKEEAAKATRKEGGSSVAALAKFIKSVGHVHGADYTSNTLSSPNVDVITISLAGSN